MRRVVVGFGNDLRGEDGFGVEVIKELEKQQLQDTKLISTFQLTPELALELKEFDEIIFVDAAHSENHHYALACNLESKNSINLSHHISIKMIMTILNTLYEVFPKHLVYSMLSSSYDFIFDEEKYKKNIVETAKQIKNL